MVRLRRFAVLAVAVCMFVQTALCAPATHAAEAGPILANNAVSAILMDATTGTVLFSKNADKKLPPASITKVMTLLIAMEALDSGKIKLTDKVRTSEHAASMGGSQIFLEPGEEMTVEDILKGISMASANDASVALAEFIGGSEETFVQMMNRRAEQLGCKNTQFRNPNGLPVEEHYSSASDIAIICRELLKHERITNFTSIYQDHLRKGSEKPFWLVNTNKLVRFYEGMDGLKTGYTSEAKYCLAATAKRNGFRLIAVALGEPTSKVRNAEISQMMDYAFANYESKVLYRSGQFVQAINVGHGKQRTVGAIVREPVGLLVKKGESATGYEKKILLSTAEAPISKGQRLGYVSIVKGGAEILRVPLHAQQAVERAGWMDLLGRTFKSWVSFGH